MLRVVFLTSPKTTRWFTMSGESEPSLCNQRHITTNLAKCLSSWSLSKLGRFWACSLFCSVQSIEKQCPTNSYPHSYWHRFYCWRTLHAWIPNEQDSNLATKALFCLKFFSEHECGWYSSALSTELVRNPRPDRRLKSQQPLLLQQEIWLQDNLLGWRQE